MLALTNSMSGTSIKIHWVCQLTCFVSSVSGIEFKSVFCIALLFLMYVIVLQNTMLSLNILHLNYSSCL
jgi:hypothetical protein